MQSQSGKTSLGASLRLSLLASLGLLPLACAPDDPTQDAVNTGTAGAGGSEPSSPPVELAGGPGKQPSGQPPVCTAPELNPKTQLMRCAEGYSYRSAPSSCQPMNGLSAAGGASGIAPPTGLPRASEHTACTALGATAPQCEEYEHGYCRTVMPSPDCISGCCFSGCVSDADCGAGSVCLCGSTRSPTGGECVSAGCATDDDCGGGYRCATYTDMCNADVHFACQTALDTCATESDCGQHPCTLTSAPPSPRQCFLGTCGRPFLVASQARTAGVITSEAWTSSRSAPRLDHLTQAERAELAQHWTRLGQLEHASIAAFARFSLQLLSLGAPPDLVEACTQALADETAHTKLCFELASAYAGYALGPGPLDVSGSLDVTTLGEITDLALAEGCFGETAAALEALEAAETATDPVIRNAYAQIARDEQRHAELAFRFVRWALAQTPTLVRARVAAALLDPPLEQRASWEVALPCLSALLALPHPLLEPAHDQLQA